MQTLVASVLLCLCEGTAVPERFAHKELALDQFCEVVDLFSSLSYVYQSFRRGFGDTNAITKSTDGRFLHPVLTCPAPQEIQALSACSSAAVGATCFEDGTCEMGANLDNCLSLTGSVSVYTVSEDACKWGDFRQCSQLLKGLFVASSLSVLLTIPLMIVGPAAGFCMAGRDFCDFAETMAWCGLPILCMTVPLYCFAYLVGGNGALAGVCISVGLPICLCCSLTLYNGFNLQDLLKSDLRKSAGFEENDVKNMELLLLLNVPILNVLVAHKMGPDKARELIHMQRPQKCIVRLTADIPEIICSTLDMLVFGVSWWAMRSPIPFVPASV